MEYFIMQQDYRQKHLPFIQVPPEFSDGEPCKDEKTLLTLYVENQGLKYQYADYLIQPFPMIGERIQNVMGKYQRDMNVQRVILIDKKDSIQHNYYRISAPEIECFSVEESEIDSENKGIKMVLNLNQLKYAKIFRVKQLKDSLLVRLDVAESILRREPEGIWFTPVKFL